MLHERRNTVLPSPARAAASQRAPDPHAPAQNLLAVVRGYDQTRRQRLVRLIASGIAILCAVLLPSVFVPVLDLVSFIALAAALVGALAAYLLNRDGQTSVAGYVMLGSSTLGIAWIIAARGVMQAITPVDLRLYDFFVLPVIVSGVLSNRRAPIAFGALTITFTIISLLVLPRSAALQLYWDGRDAQTLGSAYDVVAIPAVIQALAAVVAWLGSDSVRRSLLSATRADELAAANEQILAQARELELRQRRVRDGIEHLQAVHAAFASGNFDARAQLSGDDLQPLAINVNRFLAQMQRLVREQDQRVRMEQAASALTYALRRARAGYGYQPPHYTGTALDEALLEVVSLFQRGIASPPQVAAPPPPQEDPRTTLQGEPRAPQPWAWPDINRPNEQ